MDKRRQTLIEMAEKIAHYERNDGQTDITESDILDFFLDFHISLDDLDFLDDYIQEKMKEWGDTV